MNSCVPKVRVAPSPSGLLHIGNTRAAIMTWLFAHRYKGVVLLRLDDTDRERSKDIYTQGVYEDLKWLGWRYDETFAQSSRTAFYAEAFEVLREKGYIYPCYETSKELEELRAASVQARKAFIYTREHSKAYALQHGISALGTSTTSSSVSGRNVYWRFALNRAHPVAWQDMMKGAIEIKLSCSDPVIRKQDGAFVYTFASVVDDFQERITHVIRGEDHVSNTAVQCQIYSALARCFDGTQPKGILRNSQPEEAQKTCAMEFGHFSLLTLEGGEVFSKRQGHSSLRTLRERGIHPLTVWNYVAFVGTAHLGEKIYLDLDAMAEDVDLSIYAKGSIQMDWTIVESLQRKVLRALPFQDIDVWLNSYGISCNESWWMCIRDHVTDMHDIRQWMMAESATLPAIDLSVQERAILRDALQHFDVSALDKMHLWHDWLQAANQKPNVLGKICRSVLLGGLKGVSMEDVFHYFTAETLCARLHQAL